MSLARAISWIGGSPTKTKTVNESPKMEKIENRQNKAPIAKSKSTALAQTAVNVKSANSLGGSPKLASVKRPSTSESKRSNSIVDNTEETKITVQVGSPPQKYEMNDIDEDSFRRKSLVENNTAVPFSVAGANPEVVLTEESVEPIHIPEDVSKPIIVENRRSVHWTEPEIFVVPQRDDSLEWNTLITLHSVDDFKEIVSEMDASALRDVLLNAYESTQASQSPVRVVESSLIEERLLSSISSEVLLRYLKSLNGSDENLDALQQEVFSLGDDIELKREILLKILKLKSDINLVDILAQQTKLPDQDLLVLPTSDRDDELEAEYESISIPAITRKDSVIIAIDRLEKPKSSDEAVNLENSADLEGVNRKVKFGEVTSDILASPAPAKSPSAVLSPPAPKSVFKEAVAAFFHEVSHETKRFASPSSSLREEEDFSPKIKVKSPVTSNVLPSNGVVGKTRFSEYQRLMKLPETALFEEFDSINLSNSVGSPGSYTNKHEICMAIVSNMFPMNSSASDSSFVSSPMERFPSVSVIVASNRGAVLPQRKTSLKNSSPLKFHLRRLSREAEDSLSRENSPRVSSENLENSPSREQLQRKVSAKGSRNDSPSKVIHLKDFVVEKVRPEKPTVYRSPKAPLERKKFSPKQAVNSLFQVSTLADPVDIGMENKGKKSLNDYDAVDLLNELEKELTVGLSEDNPVGLKSNQEFNSLISSIDEMDGVLEGFLSKSAKVDEIRGREKGFVVRPRREGEKLPVPKQNEKRSKSVPAEQKTRENNQKRRSPRSESASPSPKPGYSKTGSPLKQNSYMPGRSGKTPSPTPRVRRENSITPTAKLNDSENKSVHVNSSSSLKKRTPLFSSSPAKLLPKFGSSPQDLANMMRASGLSPAQAAFSPVVMAEQLSRSPIHQIAALLGKKKKLITTVEEVVGNIPPSARTPLKLSERSVGELSSIATISSKPEVADSPGPKKLVLPRRPLSLRFPGDRNSGKVSVPLLELGKVLAAAEVEHNPNLKQDNSEVYNAELGVDSSIEDALTPRRMMLRRLIPPALPGTPLDSARRASELSSPSQRRPSYNLDIFASEESTIASTLGSVIEENSKALRRTGTDVSALTEFEDDSGAVKGGYESVNIGEASNAVETNSATDISTAETPRVRPQVFTRLETKENMAFAVYPEESDSNPSSDNKTRIKPAVSSDASESLDVELSQPITPVDSYPGTPGDTFYYPPITPPPVNVPELFPPVESAPHEVLRTF